jgi:hypothetical protein
VEEIEERDTPSLKERGYPRGRRRSALGQGLQKRR